MLSKRYGQDNWQSTVRMGLGIALQRLLHAMLLRAPVAVKGQDPQQDLARRPRGTVRRHPLRAHRHRQRRLRNRHLPASGIQDAILAAVADHTRGVAQSDDITLVVIRRQD